MDIDAKHSVLFAIYAEYQKDILDVAKAGTGTEKLKQLAGMFGKFGWEVLQAWVSKVLTQTSM